MIKDQTTKQLFSAYYIHYYFASQTKSGSWWLDDQGNDFWSGVYTFDSDALYYLTEGEFDLRIGTERNRIRPGQMVYIPAGTEHERRICSEKALRKYYTHFDLALGKDPLTHYFKVPYIVDINDPERAIALFEELQRCYHKDEFPSAAIGGNGALLQLIGFFLEQSGARSIAAVSREEQSMETAIKYIHTHLHQPMAVAELAELAGYSPNHFTKLFKKNHGCLPLDYIADVKLKQAKKRLRETKVPLAVLAEELGFCDASHFGKFFKKHTDLTPAQYRKNIKHRI